MFAALFQSSVCQFASARYNEAQIKFSNVHKLILAVYWAIKHFRPYI